MKPIGFKEEMYRAVVEGRKTQTRRIPEKQPDSNKLSKGRVVGGKPRTLALRDGMYRIPSKYEVGDVLYLTEPVRIITDEIGMLVVTYLWGGEILRHKFTDEIRAKLDARKRGPHAPTTARFMLKAFAREFVRVTDVRLERVQDISEDDAIAEGIALLDCYPSRLRAVEWFSKLWDSINAKRGHSWESNPWVWAYTLERTDPVS